MSESYIRAALRRQVRERADSCCEYCLLAEADAFFPHEPDHIIAVKHGGANALNNLCWACFDCNRFKGSDIASHDAISGELVPLFNPRTHIWSEHFQVLPQADRAVGFASVILEDRLDLPTATKHYSWSAAWYAIIRLGVVSSKHVVK